MGLHHLPIAVAAGLLVSISGCDASGESGFGFSLGTEPPIYTGPMGLTLGYPNNLLSGDTARVISFGGTQPLSWEMSGPAVFVLGSDSGTTQSLRGAPSVLIRGVGVGAATITVSSGQERSTRTFLVADPSAVRLRIVQGNDARIVLGMQRWMLAQLLDAAGNYYSYDLGDMTWTSRDPTIVQLILDSREPRGRFALANAVGSTTLVVAFRAQRDSTTVVVEH